MKRLLHRDARTIGIRPESCRGRMVSNSIGEAKQAAILVCLKARYIMGMVIDGAIALPFPAR